MPRVTLIRDREKVCGWPTWPEGERTPVAELSTALTRMFTSDAHFTQYASPIRRRLNKSALEQGMAVTMTCLVFDVDDAEKHGTGEPASDAWRADMRARMAQLHDAHPSPFYYETKGGSRIVYALPQSVTLHSREDDRRWSQQYAVALAYFARRFGIEADPACADWTRLFRLPHATRESGGKPESWLVVGDPKNIGALRIAAAPEDMERARQNSKAFREARAMDFTPCAGDGQGLLLHLLRAQGALIRPHGQNAYVVRCPNERSHTSGRTGDGSTLLYMAAQGEEIGAIHCMHAHCAGLRVRDWLRFFSATELDLARQAAGLRRSA